MSWMVKLYETYEAGMQLDLSDSDRLMPICHTPQNAHIKICIDSEGNFKHAQVLEKTQIVLPATEKSAGRSSGEAPHPLADKIQYVAKDYAEFGGKKKAYFKGYLEQLGQWSESQNSHIMVKAVKQYVEKGTVVRDLIEQSILFTDENNDLLLSWPKDSENDPPSIFRVLPKEKGQLDQGNALVCWDVVIPGDSVSETWTDQTLQQSWVDFELAKNDETGLCFITGEQLTLATSHPAKLRHTGDKAKLVSSNDLSGYTFKGRFTDTKTSIERHGAQSVGIAFDVTQKAHNALRWLISRQGYRNGDQVIVSWAISGKEIPQPMSDTVGLIGMDFEEEVVAQVFEEKPIDHSINLGFYFASALKKYMTGFSAKFDVTDNIIIMGLDSATPGRMAVTYYQEFFPKQYIEQVTCWHEDFAWFQRFKKDKKTIWPISTPTPRAICEAVYGATVSDSLKKNTIERILPCIVEERSFPRDLVEKAVYHAGNRSLKRLSAQFSNLKSERAAWEKHLGIACSLYRGFSKRNLIQPKEYDMALEEKNHSRDYLYGRLLAIAEHIEEIAMFVAKEKARSTQASRLMQRFSAYPFSTWKTIEEGINPYQQRLKSKVAPLEGAYKQLLDDVCDKFERDDFVKSKKLSGEYLLSYHLQRKWLREHKFQQGQWVLRDACNSDDIQPEGEK